MPTTGVVQIWRKSRKSASGNCVEVAFVGEVVMVRDSKDPSGDVLEFGAREWTDFVDAIRGRGRMLLSETRCD
jgi:Domain of unknown function (DUF397)